MTEPITVLQHQFERLSSQLDTLQALPQDEAIEAQIYNLEAIRDSIFDQLVNPTAYDSHQLLGEELSTGLSAAGAHLSVGLAWAGFWIGFGAVLVAAIVKAS